MLSGKEAPDAVLVLQETQPGLLWFWDVPFYTSNEFFIFKDRIGNRKWEGQNQGLVRIPGLGEIFLHLRAYHQEVHRE